MCDWEREEEAISKIMMMMMMMKSIENCLHFLGHRVRKAASFSSFVCVWCVCVCVVRACVCCCSLLTRTHMMDHRIASVEGGGKLVACKEIENLKILKWIL